MTSPEKGRVWRILANAAALLIAAVALVLLAALPLNWKDQAVFGAFPVLLGWLIARRSKSRRITLVLVFLSLFCSVRYIWWRTSQTVGYMSFNLSDTPRLDAIFMALLLGAELYAFVILVLGYFQTARPLRRLPVPLPDDPDTWPEVDVYIPTYNEPLDVIRSTVLASMNLDWPPDRFHVYILDDGRRPHIRDFAEECGCGYIIRPDNKHAKAGNLNYAMTQTSAEYIAIFDCDHIPTRSFLQMTMGWFLRDPKLGMLQTPHHFYSPDPFERNLGTFRKIPNEGALFYGVVQDGNDLWNATFFCGSCAVLRRTALQEIGGVAVETVTEDAHTALRLQRKGWNTAYINIPQAAGLATATLAAHIGQRIRWARGMIQILRVDNPLLGRGLKFSQRICYFNAVIHFMYALPRLIFLTAPLVYLLLGRSNFYGYVLAILSYSLPHLILSTIANSRIQGRFRYSFWNEIYETVLAPYILLPTLLALVNPKWGKFNVTAKENTIEGSYLDWKVAWPFVVILGLNLLGIGLAIPRVMALQGSSLDDGNTGTLIMNLFWACFNSVILGASVAVAYESRQLRSSVRVDADIPMRLLLSDGRSVETRTSDLSTGGAAVTALAPLVLREGDDAVAVFPTNEGEHAFPVTFVGSRRANLGLQFRQLSLDQEEALTRVIYSRANSWLNWKGTDEDRPLRSLGMIARIAVQGLAALPRGLRQGKSGNEGTTGGWVLRWVILALVLALLFAMRSASAATASTPEPAPATFNEVQAFSALGQKQPVNLRGADGRATMYFGVPLAKVASQASLALDYRVSSVTVPEASTIAVSLNGAAVSSVRVTREDVMTGRLARATISLPAELLARENALTFQFQARCAGCGTGPDSGLWAKIEPSSEIRLSGLMLALPNDIGLLPAPFFDSSLRRTIPVPVVFLDDPGPQLLQAAGVLASWFGKMADTREVRFPVSFGRIPSGNAVVFTTRSERASALVDVRSTAGPAVLLAQNPSDAFGKVLVVLGDNETEILAAARALAADQYPKHGERAELRAASLPAARKPYDAPKWLNTDRPIRLGDRTTAEQLQVIGTGSFNFYFRLAPDLHFASTSEVPFRLHYKCAGISSSTRGYLKVRINGSQVKVKRIASRPGVVQREVVLLPSAALFARNTLTIDFDFEQSPDAAESPEVTILPSSELDFRGITRFVKMPKLELFVQSGFPFSRVADLSESAVVLPAHPTAEETGLFLGVLGTIGFETGTPALNVSVLNAGQAERTRDKDLLVIGTASDQPLFARWASRMPVHIAANRAMRFNASAAPLDTMDRLLRPALGRERQGLADLLEGARVEAVVEGFFSPVGAGRSVVVLAAGDSHAVEGLETILGESGAPDVLGHVAVLAGGKWQSFHLPQGSYHLGQLQWRDGFNYWMVRYYGLIPIVIIICAFLLAIRAEGWLERRAQSRLNVGS